MQQYEYKYEEISWQPNRQTHPSQPRHSADDIVSLAEAGVWTTPADALNALGSQGWQLISFQHTFNDSRQPNTEHAFVIGAGGAANVLMMRPK